MFDRLKLRNRPSRWLVELAIFAAIFFSIQTWQQRDVPYGHPPRTGGYLADGQAFCLNDWREKHPDRAVAVHFWADWCPICSAEEGNVTSVMKDWPVMTIAMQSGPATEVANHLRKKGLNWPALVDTDGKITAGYGLKGVPAFVVIDRNGIIRSVSTGYTSELGMWVRLWWADRF